MKNFYYYNPTKIFFGREQQKEVGEIISQYKVKKIMLVHYGKDFLESIGIKDDILNSLENASIEYVEFTGIEPNPRVTTVYKGIELARKEDVEFILAVGGGSVIDTAKAIALGKNYPGDIWELYVNARTDFEDILPTGCILTIPAAGSETSNGSILTNPELEKKMFAETDLLRPKFAIMNPEVTYKLPPYQTACGIVDIMSHVMERYFTNEKSNDLSDRLCEASLKNLLTIAPLLMEDPTNYDYRAEIMWAGTVGNNTIEGCGRVEDWACHWIQHELGAIYDMAHGAGLAVVTPAWMKYVYKYNVGRFVQFAVRVMGIEEAFDDMETIALRGIEKLEKFFVQLGMPVRLSELSIDDEKFEIMAERAVERGNIGNLKVLDKEDVIEILKLCK